MSDPTLEEVGEQAVLDAILPILPRAGAEEMGPGDDAALISAPRGAFVATTDLMVEGPDFRTAWSKPYDLGWKIAATNLADVAAMGATPSSLLLGLAAPATFRVSDAVALARGLADCCEALAPGCSVSGGDLSTSEVLTLAMTAFGNPPAEGPVTRFGARPGDVVAVCGTLGRAAAGVDMLFVGAPIDATRDATLIRTQLRPEPPVSAGPRVAGVATAMMDVSDGLAMDAARIARAADVRVELRRELVQPFVDDVAAGFDELRERWPECPSHSGDDLTRYVVGGGEDHSLLATFPPDRELPEGFRPVGHVAAFDPVGARVVLEGEAVDSGWDPFRGR